MNGEAIIAELREIRRVLQDVETKVIGHESEIYRRNGGDKSIMTRLRDLEQIAEVIKRLAWVSLLALAGILAINFWRIVVLQEAQQHLQNHLPYIERNHS